MWRDSMAVLDVVRMMIRLEVLAPPSRFGRSHSCPWQRRDPAEFRAAMAEKRKLDAAKREARESETRGRGEL